MSGPPRKELFSDRLAGRLTFDDDVRAAIEPDIARCRDGRAAAVAAAPPALERGPAESA